MTEPRKPALLGLSAYFLTGLTIGTTYLIAHGILALNPVSSRLDGPIALAIRDGTGLTMTLFAFLLILPLLTAAVAALMGRHGGRTGQKATGAAAVTTLIGVPILWVTFAIASLLVAVILREQGFNRVIGDTTDALIASGLQVLLVLGPLVALAAIIAHRGHTWAQHTEAAIAGGYEHPATGGEEQHEHALGATDPSAWAASGGPAAYEDDPGEETTTEGTTEATDALFDHPVDCPRCGRTFSVTGERPLRITCPDCGKTGTIA